jgi:hypothetical protein
MCHQYKQTSYPELSIFLFEEELSNLGDLELVLSETQMK